MKSTKKLQNTVYSSIDQDADGIYPKLYVFNTPVQKEGNLPGVHIHTVCNLLFGHSSELKVILNGVHIHTVCNLLFGHSSELKVILN